MENLKGKQKNDFIQIVSFFVVAGFLFVDVDSEYNLTVNSRNVDL